MTELNVSSLYKLPFLESLYEYIKNIFLGIKKRVKCVFSIDFSQVFYPYNEL